MQYETRYPHNPINPGHPLRSSLTKRYDPLQAEFLVYFEDFLFSDPHLIDNPGNKPATFELTNQQVMTDFARLIREHVEDFISKEILDKATLVNDEPIIKWMVTYPDILDAQKSPGVTCKRDFVIAFKNAGYPLEDYDIPILVEEGEEEAEDGYSQLEDLATESRMVEFLSSGYAGLIGYASLQPINPHIPAIPARFGVVHHPLCSATPSPVFKQLPEEYITFLITKFVREGIIPHEEGVEVDISGDPEMVDYVSSFVITDWPECPAWKDVVDTLTGNLSKRIVDLETDPENHPSGVIRKFGTSALGFSMLVTNGIGVPSITAFGAVHMNEPTMTDVVLFDSNRGEEDAYRAVFDWVNIPKDAPANHSPSVTSNDEQLAPTSESPTQEDPWPIVIESPDYIKLMADGDKESMGLSDDDVKQLREASATRRPFDKEKYRKLRVVRPQSNGIWLEVGLCEAVRLECARIYGDALRK
ncbi:hypothetical protein ABW19_dt0200294 [Dactylella cylindrospora]|nr:hypothetical protein ABW19_dt0200294 [Dactylella cylindrospora]